MRVFPTLKLVGDRQTNRKVGGDSGVSGVAVHRVPDSGYSRTALGSGVSSSGRDGRGSAGSGSSFNRSFGDPEPPR